MGPVGVRWSSRPAVLLPELQVRLQLVQCRISPCRRGETGTTVIVHCGEGGLLNNGAGGELDGAQHGPSYSRSGRIRQRRNHEAGGTSMRLPGAVLTSVTAAAVATPAVALSVASCADRITRDETGEHLAKAQDRIVSGICLAARKRHDRRDGRIGRGLGHTHQRSTSLHGVSAAFHQFAGYQQQRPRLLARQGYLRNHHEQV